MPILDSNDVNAVWARSVSRIPGAPTTILQDCVDGTTHAMSANSRTATLLTKADQVIAKLDAANTKLDQTLVRLNALTGDNINTLALQVATELHARLSGPNGHIMSDGDVDRFADATADIVWVRLQQYLEAQD